MKVRDLSPRDLRKKLSRGELMLQAPPFVARLRSDLDRVAEDLQRLYADFEVGEPEDFADFHLEVLREHGLRRWYKPMARFFADGEPAFSMLPAEQGFHMIEWGLNWAVSTMAHPYLSYHAAALERGGRALVMPAPPGSGKSTLSAALAHRGWRLMSDEITLYDITSQQVRGMGRPVNLKNVSIDLIRRFAPQAELTRPVPDTTKGTLALMKAPGDSVARVLESAQPAWIIIPRYTAGAAPALAPLPKARMLLLLAEQAFNYDIHGRQGFEATADLVERCECLEFTYSALDEAVQCIADLTR
ncbi:HprK-related kinase A [Paucibacter sp. R3-3]|uniref:HprK-related kinase A n=1 Tax=Roseateles agri TaxID=3098619 RepID=A0ABU5DLT2_9BURK|nr:HprK-related kinase A [Paucibacter sp. R3-3]MDY0747262.1 HprK-related kinase A [Paucibacter sp. R3-3]